LAVDAAYRRQGQLGPTLIRLAVCSAHALGCEAFYAQVQHQNEPLFRRMRWQTLEWLELRGVRHARMQADLAFYPPCDDPRSGMVIPTSRPPRTADAAAFLTGGRV
ncbi:histone acetyltransferase, partial [Klebsiella pneumoniae]|nr:histone acetyltransferase [Klebsiella pneumoniae]